MTVLELGHPSWERPDADGVAQALTRHASCISVRIRPPEENRAGWAVAATYVDAPAPRLVPTTGVPASGGRR